MVIDVTMAVVVSVTTMYMNNFRMSVVTGDVLRGVSMSISMSVLGGREGDEGGKTQYLKYRQNIITQVYSIFHICK